MAQKKNTDMSPPVFRTDLIGFSDIKCQSIKGWEEYLLEGRQYLNTATRAFAEGRSAFTPEILYNVIAMAIEKMVMGALMEQGKLPYNHTMRDLVEAMEEHLPDKILGLGRQLTAL
ncbi:MAG: hypothetical protein KJ717_03325, partial [Proteobacteria bacterium]|nr:hypothetical protein [Pseudomonadota bacterium]